MEQKKDFSLLRPFDPEATKNGAPLVWRDGNGILKYIGEPVSDLQSQFGTLVLQWIDTVRAGMVGIYDQSDIRMAPLAWVERRPVYTGDVLYYNRNTRSDLVGQKQTVITFSSFIGAKRKPGFILDNGHLCYLDELTWTPPKVKREGWALVQKACIHKLKSDVEDIYNNIGEPKRWAIIHVEWEE